MWKFLFAAAALCALQSASATIYHPCQLDDFACIGASLAYNSECIVKKKPTLEHDVYEDFFSFEAPNFNASYTDVDLHMRNLDKCVVSAFYYNGTSDTAVLGIDCPNLEVESDRIMYQHRSLQEDSVYNFHIKGTYPLIRLTMTMPHARHLSTCNSYTFADVTALPIFHLQPKDEPTSNYLSRDMSRLFTYERETFLYRGPRIARHFVNHALCYFGCW